jgi:hypothetical protein
MFTQALRLFSAIFLLAAIGAAQDEPSIADIARQERARKAAARAAAGPELGTAPPVAIEGEIVPAHFLRFEGEVGAGEFAILLNGKMLLRNGRVRGLPIYVTPLLLEGPNLLGVQFTSDASHPLDIIVEERFPGDAEHHELVHFHADANQFPEAAAKQMSFTVHPKVVPNVVLTDADRVAIHGLVQSFYNALNSKDGPAVLKLFEASIQDARDVYPEGADYGQDQMDSLAEIASQPDFIMEPYVPGGLEMIPNGSTVTVKRPDGKPVFVSIEVSGPVDGGGGNSRVSADVVPVKKIKGGWRLTLPFGF